MAINPLPPQAYTKETLQKAYAWLLTQSSSVKEMAQDQNILVSLYLKAQRNGESSLEAPSILNFKQELKSLANMMGDFHQPQSSSQITPNTSHALAIESLPAVNPTFTTQSIQTQTIQTTTQTHKDTSTVSLTQNANLSQSLDAKSFEAVEQVKKTLNLSSDTEALRVLITLGIKHFNKLDI